MNIYQRLKVIDVDLGHLTMKEIMNFPSRGDAGFGGFYLKELFHTNHLQIGIKERKYTSIHDFEYDEVRKQIRIFSRIEKSAFLIYGYLSIPILLLVRNQNSEFTVEIIVGTFVLFIFQTLILSLGMKSESKEIEREMVIRINYARRNKY